MRYKKVSRVVLVYYWQYMEPPGVMRMLIPFYVHVQKKGLAGITVSGSDHQRKGGIMFFRINKNIEEYTASNFLGSTGQIFLPAIAFIFLYMALQYACLLFFRRLGDSGSAPLSVFIRERPGLCMTFSMVIPMSVSLWAVFGEGRRRLAAFKKEGSGRAAERGRLAGIPAMFLLTLCTCAFCIFGNALIQAMGLNSDSVSAMQPVYNEIPFPFLLLLFAGFTPFAEEFVFRGLVYTGLRRRFPPFLSAAMAAACFGLYHGELIQGTYAFCMGVIFGISMELSGDIRMPWLLHCLANGLPLCLSYFGLWETFAGPAGRACTLFCLLLSAGFYGAFSARRRERK